MMVKSGELAYLANSSKPGNIYLVQPETDQQIDSILSHQLLTESIDKDTPLELDTTGLIKGSGSA